MIATSRNPEHGFTNGEKLLISVTDNLSCKRILHILHLLASLLVAIIYSAPSHFGRMLRAGCRGPLSLSLALTHTHTHSHTHTHACIAVLPLSYTTVSMQRASCYTFIRPIYHTHTHARTHARTHTAAVQCPPPPVHPQVRDRLLRRTQSAPSYHGLLSVPHLSLSAIMHSSLAA